MLRTWRRARWLIFGTIFVAALNTGEAAGPDIPANSIPLARVPHVFGITVDRADRSNLVLATRSGLFRATPDGSAIRVSESRNVLWDIVPHPRIGNVLFAAGITEHGRNDGPLTSTDAGRTWRRLVAGNTEALNFRRLDLSAAKPTTVYGLASEVWISRDAGVSWNRAGPINDEAIDIAASSRHPDRVYAATFGGLMVSADGGGSWKFASPGLCRQPVTTVTTAPAGTLYAFSLCEGFLRGDELTGAWTAVNNAFGGCIIQHIAVDPTDADKVFAVAQCNVILASVDGGKTWKPFDTSQAEIPTCSTSPLGRDGIEELEEGPRTDLENS